MERLSPTNDLAKYHTAKGAAATIAGVMSQSCHPERARPLIIPISSGKRPFKLKCCVAAACMRSTNDSRPSSMSNHSSPEGQEKYETSATSAYTSTTHKKSTQPLPRFSSGDEQTTLLHGREILNDMACFFRQHISSSTDTLNIKTKRILALR